MATIGQIYEASDGFAAALLRQEQAAERRLVQAYGNAWRRIREDILRLSREIRERKGERLRGRAAERLAEDRLTKARLEAIERQILSEVQPLLERTADETIAMQADFVRAAEHHTEQLILLQQPQLVAAIELNRLPTEVFRAIVGFMGDGLPLRDVLEARAGKHAAAVRELLEEAIAKGWNPVKTAREGRRRFGLSQLDAMRIMRTETLRAHREATHQTFKENRHVLKGWVWNATLNGRTCAACLAKHGTRHPVDERMNEHVNGRCSQIPITQAWEELQDRGSQSRDPVTFLDAQDAEVQRRILGSKVAQEAYARGEVELKDFAGWRVSDKWGTSIHRRSYRDASAIAERRRMREAA